MANPKLNLRYPICSWHLALYMLVGGGTTYANNLKRHGQGHVGAGLEYRFTPNRFYACETVCKSRSVFSA